MKSFTQLKKAVKDNVPLVWNDPDPIKGNDYTITYIEPLDDFEDDDRDIPILIQYGGGSEAEVYLHEIIKKQLHNSNNQFIFVNIKNIKL